MKGRHHAHGAALLRFSRGADRPRNDGIGSHRGEAITTKAEALAAAGIEGGPVDGKAQRAGKAQASAWPAAPWPGPVTGGALYGAEIGLGDDLQPVNDRDLDGQHNDRQRRNQGEGVAKQIDHRALQVDLLMERANMAGGNSGKVGAWGSFCVRRRSASHPNQTKTASCARFASPISTARARKAGLDACAV